MALDTFGKRLKVLRIDREMSQIELRDKMAAIGTDIGETYISELERTSKTPTLGVAAAMARVLNVSLDYLAMLTDEQISYTRVPAPEYFSEEADAIAEIVDRLPPERRTALLSVARSLSVPNQRDQAESAANVAGWQAVQAVLRRRMAADEYDALLDEMAQSVPEFAHLRRPLDSGRAAKQRDVG